MTQISRRLIAPDQDVLSAIAQFVQTKFPKYELDTQADSVSARRKVLWQKQEATFQVTGGQLTVTGNCQEADKVVYKTLKAIDEMIDDRGWAEAARTHGIKSVAKGHLLKDQVLDALEPTERIVVAAQGHYDGKITVLTVTEKRILVVSNDVIGFQGASKTIALDKVSSISEKTGWALGSIRISTSNDEIEVEKVATDEAKAVVSAARRALEQVSAPSSAPESSGSLDDLQKLADLHAAGVLTDEEFAAAKAKALGL